MGWKVKQCHTDRLTHSPLGSYCVATRIDRDSYHVVRERVCMGGRRENRRLEGERGRKTVTHTCAVLRSTTHTAQQELKESGERESWERVVEGKERE